VTEYLSVDQLIALHGALIREFGGSSGVRDRGALESSVARPAMTFAGEDLYVDLAAKAAALMHSLVLNHAFVDGNKRVGVAAAELFLEYNDHTMEATDEELEAVTMSVAEGKLEVEALAIWIRQRLRAP
jgi:death-on-curing protein